MAVFRVPGGSAAPLAEILKIFQAHIIAGEVKQAIEEHGGMASGEHESVPVGPIRVGRIVPHDAGPENVPGRGQPHRGAGMAGVGLLDGIHGQGSDGVHGLLIDVQKFAGRHLGALL